MIRTALLLLALTLPTVAQPFPGPPPGRRPFREPQSSANEISLGKSLFFDTTLSNPAGMSCATCHAPEAGFSNGKSIVNRMTGVVPGVVAGRFGNRKPPTIAYAAFLPRGDVELDPRRNRYEGGLFWDGRAADLQAQATAPLQNPNEMNNLLHGVASPAMVVQKLKTGTNAKLFEKVYGSDVFDLADQDIFNDAARAIAAYENSDEVSPFTSKYDAYVAGKAKLTDSEMNGLRLATGSTTGRPGGPRFKNAHCTQCHSIAPNNDGIDLFTNSTYINTGIPRNLDNPYYKETNAKENPQGYNALGANYIDFGLGTYLYTKLGLPPGNVGPGATTAGDYLYANGRFKTPTLRNVDKRPSTDFIKCYGHNGVFKTLKQIVHFYNTRNLTTQNEVIDFAKANPYASLRGRPLWPTPEFSSATTLENPEGIARRGQVGNLGLTDREENDIVAFLQTLSDGYFTK